MSQFAWNEPLKQRKSEQGRNDCAGHNDRADDLILACKGWIFKELEQAQEIPFRAGWIVARTWFGRSVEWGTPLRNCEEGDHAYHGHASHCVHEDLLGPEWFGASRFFGSSYTVATKHHDVGGQS